MKTRIPFILVAFVAFGGPTEIQATRVTGADVFARWQQTRIERLGPEQASVATQDIVRQMLSTPTSPYSDVIAQPEFTNDVDWSATVDAFSARGLTADDALAALRWDLGMTRARPRIDVNVRAGFRDDLIAASATKADVDPDVFWHVLDLTGFRHSTKAAIYAVGMQILRAQAIAVPPEQWIANAIDPDVFTRVMRAQHMDQLQAYDLEYLSTLVQYRLLHWQAGAESSTGHRSLPVVYRVARTAAAYRDAQGYVGSFPCMGDGSPRASSAGMGGDDERPLCFTAATDRAVHAWYLAEYVRQATYVPEHHEGGFSRLAKFAGLVLTLVDLAGVLEFVEATVADSLVASEAIGDAEAEASFARADLLSCPILSEFMRRHLIMSLGAGATALVAAHAHAAPVIVEPIGLDRGNVTAQLERSSQYFVNAMRKLIVQSYREQYRAIRWENLEAAMNRSRVARFEYRFMRNGTEQIRVYHAMDGLPLSVTAEDTFGGTTPRGSPTPPQSPSGFDSPAGSDSEETTDPKTSGTKRDLVDADIGDDVLFDEFDSMNVRARLLPSSGSVLDSYTAPGAQGGLDAEFKAMRTIENDIRTGVVPRGGRIRGAVGGATCGSCEDAMRDLSREYGVEVRVSHMFGSIPSGEQKALIQSGSARLKGRMLVGPEGEPLLARDVLNSARTAQIRRDLSPRALDRTFKGLSWRQRSFRLGPPRLPRVSEGSSTEDTAVSGESSATPGC